MRVSRRNRAAARPGEAGFTLMETMVAVALIGLLSLVMVEAARFSRLSYQRSLSASDALKESVETRQILTGLIEGAEPLLLEDQEGERAVFFDGGPTRLTLVAPYSALGAARNRHLAGLASRPGLAVFSIGLEPLASGGEGLVLRHAPFEAKSRDGWRAQRPVLLSAAEGAAFRYFGRETDEEDSGVWSAEWRLKARTPLAVSVGISGGAFDAGAPLILRPVKRADSF